MHATDTTTDFVILLSFPRQEWLRERASMYIACLIIIICRNARAVYVERTC
jgi:hypothetical protein